MTEITPRKIKGYGWKPGLPDHRAWKYSDHFEGHGFMLPPIVDLRPQDSLVYDQGDLGSCTANAIGGMCQFVTKKLQKKYQFTPSRLFIYYNERVIERTIAEDAGAALSDGMATIHKQGVANETNWPYNISKFAVKPPQSVYTNGLQHIVGNYFSIDNSQITQLKNCLVSGFPFVFGFAVYESFESSAVAKTGIVPMPGQHERQLGGHAVMAVGYDDNHKWFIIRNSWGSGWGAKGYCFLPYSYVCNINMAEDFWTMRTIG